MLVMINSEKGLKNFLKKVKDVELIHTTRKDGLINGCQKGETFIQSSTLDGTIVAQYFCKLVRSRGRNGRQVPREGSLRAVYVDDVTFKKYMD